MPCSITCMVAAVFVIATIYFQNATTKSKVIQVYKDQLPSNLQNLYEKITKERLKIYYYGYILGFLLSIVIIYNNYFVKRPNNSKLTTTSIVCLVIVVSFITNYFYYILSPKSSWMLDHINSPEQTKAWLAMYRSMQVYYHSGLALGIIAIGIFAFAFRC